MINAYTFRRLSLFAPTVILVSLGIFLLMRVLPGDIASIMAASEDGGGGERVEVVRAQLGLDDPLPLQYWDWVSGLAQGDFGNSLVRPTVSVSDEIVKRGPRSLELAIIALPIAVLTGILTGVLSAVFRSTWIDHAGRLLAFIGLGVPNFVLGTLALYFLLRLFDWRPPLAYASIFDDPKANLTMMVLPALVLAWGPNAALARVTRSTVLEVINQDYVRTAHSKGLRLHAVVVRHVLPNALLPIVTLVGLQFANLVSGVVIVETIFNVPGLGRLMVDGIRTRDYPIVQNLVLLLSLVVLTLNLLVDLLYPYIDPRVRNG